MTNELEGPAAQLLDAYKAAVFAKDVDAFVALYDEGVCIFDTWNQWSYRGLEVWRGMIATWFGAHDTERVVVDFSHVQIVGAQDVVVVHTTVTYSGVSTEGVKLRAVQNRMTVVLEQKSSGWKIVHEHTSLPTDYETMKAVGC